MNDQLLFFFSAIGVLNGLLLTFYFLFYAKPKHSSNIFLGFLFLVLSIRIGKSVFFFFRSDLSGSFIQLGLTACFFIGPFVYFYITSVLAPENGIQKTWKYHVLLLLPIILTAGILYPYITHKDLWKGYFFKVIYLEWALYLIASGIIMIPVFKKLFSKSRKLLIIEIWLLNIFLGNVLIWVAYFFSYYTSYIAGAISFSLLTYLLILLLVFSRQKQSVLFKKAFKYSDKKIRNEEAEMLLHKLHTLMTEEKLFKDANLKLGEVAKHTTISSHQLSQLLNDNLGKSFSHWVNEFRISEAQKLIESNKKFSLESIGYECGFNSKSTFYASFKKFVAMTPAQFKESIS